MFFLLLIKICCSTLFYLENDKSVESSIRLKGSTVVLMQVKLFSRGFYKSQWEEVQEFTGAVKLKIHKFSDDYLYEEPDSKNMILNDSMQRPSGTFFFTTPEAGRFLMVFSVETNTDKELALELAIHDGKPWVTDIVSGTDYQIDRLAESMRELLHFAQNSFELQNLEEEDEVKYVNTYNGVLNIIKLIIMSNVVVIFITVFYINKKIREFYISKKILKAKI